MLLAIIVLLTLVPIIMAMFLWQGAPFVRTSKTRTTILIQAAEKFKPKHTIDLGCGDGSLVIALARAGYKVDGIEIQPWLVWRAKRNIRKHHLEKSVNIYWGSFWRYNLSKYDLVVVFGMQHIMPRLESKLLAELDEKTHVVSNTFVFPNLSVVSKNGKITSYKI
jgi:2-polyprenyl-3-methyl-5-hydroxy-6-metoxy-1,4-benzoquinol methylase